MGEFDSHTLKQMYAGTSYAVKQYASMTAFAQIQLAFMLFTASITATSRLFCGDLQINAANIRISARAVVPVALRSCTATLAGRDTERSSLLLSRIRLLKLLFITQ